LKGDIVMRKHAEILTAPMSIAFYLGSTILLGIGLLDATKWLSDMLIGTNFNPRVLTDAGELAPLGVLLGILALAVIALASWTTISGLNFVGDKLWQKK